MTAAPGHRPVILSVLFAGAAIAAPAQANETLDADLPAICEWAAREAAQAEGIPQTVLAAISLAETGRRHEGRLRPWPWTVNMEGAGHWFPNREEALAFVHAKHGGGATSFDVGCFQINFKYHGARFASIEEMFDPLANALYAARFLKELHAEMGDWTLAAGAYHSRTPEFADRYKDRFARIREGLVAEYGDEIPVIPQAVLASLTGAEPAAPRINNFPLLQAGSGAGLGSLVPIGNAGGVRLFGSSSPGAAEGWK